MGRRALQKPPADLVLQPYLLTAEDLPKPWDDVALFERQAPLEVEIGSGKGKLTKHLLELGNDVTGIDVDFRAIKSGHIENGELPVFVANGDSLPFAQEVFDVVLSFDVFEHIPDSDRHLDEVLKHLLGDLEVCNDAILQRPDRRDVSRRTTQHTFGVNTHCRDTFLIIDIIANGDH